MIRASEKVEYCKSKTMTCDDDYVSLKSSKTLNIDNAEEEYEKIGNERGDVQNMNDSENVSLYKNKKYNTKKNVDKSNVDMCEGNNIKSTDRKSNNTIRNSSKYNGLEERDDKENNNNNNMNSMNSMYDRNVANTTYYENESFDNCSKESKDLSEKFMNKNMIDNNNNNNNNTIMNEDDIFMKYIEDTKNNDNSKNFINDKEFLYSMSKEKYAETNRSTTEVFDNMNCIEYSNEYKQTNNEIINNTMMKEDTNKDDIKNVYRNISMDSKDFSGINFNEMNVEENNSLVIGNNSNLESYENVGNESYIENIMYRNKNEHNEDDKDEEDHNSNNNYNLNEKNGNYKNILSNQDIYKETENANDNTTTECISVKDVPKFITNNPMQDNLLNNTYLSKDLNKNFKSYEQVYVKDNNSLLHTTAGCDNKNRSYANFHFNTVENKNMHIMMEEEKYNDHNKAHHEIDDNGYIINSRDVVNNKDSFYKSLSQQMYIDKDGSKYNVDIASDLFEKKCIINDKNIKNNYNENNDILRGPGESDMSNNMYISQKGFQLNQEGINDMLRNQNNITYQNNQYNGYIKDEKNIMGNLCERIEPNYIDSMSKRDSEGTNSTVHKNNINRNNNINKNNNNNIHGNRNSNNIHSNRNSNNIHSNRNSNNIHSNRNSNNIHSNRTSNNINSNRNSNNINSNRNSNNINSNRNSNNINSNRNSNNSNRNNYNSYVVPGNMNSNNNDKNYNNKNYNNDNSYDKSLDEYFRNNLPEDIIKNMKYENPSNTYNDLLNNRDYDLISKIKENPVYYASEKEKKRMKNKDMKQSKYVSNEKLDSDEHIHIYKNNNEDNNSMNRDTTIISKCDNPETHYGQGNSYMLPACQRNDLLKDDRNPMLSISKQKIKNIWSKFKNNSCKEHNVNRMYESKNNNYVQKMEMLNIPKKGLGNEYYNYPYNNNNNINNNNIINNNNNNNKDCINKPIIYMNNMNNNNMDKQMKPKCIFNWKIAKKSLMKMLQSAHNFYFNGVKYSDWKFTCIPTLGFSKSSNRVQQMYRAFVVPKDNNVKKEVKLFIKKIPIYIWVKQFNLMNEFDGEYVTDGENFVMEATALAFLNEYHPGITPKLYRILYEPDNKYFNEGLSQKSMYNNLNVFNDMLSERLKCNAGGNIVIVSEFFNEDILDFIDRRQKKYNMKISNNEKSFILYQCLKLLIRLHDAGLSHLDLTPENILISDNYDLRFCDLSKSTPIYTYNLRHIKDMNRLYLFESCEPTIAKGAYMPPECWKIYWKYDTMKIKNPLKDLKHMTDQEKRKQFYFDVSSADKFMLGVFFFWIWTNGNLWKCSDPLQDEDFFYFVKCDMNFDNFELTKNWPNELKDIIKQLLHAEHRKKLNLKDLSAHPWWSFKL
ncbi:serine/threonine protein kinase, FIKK family [Plasmodium sp. DRC-Itaito]|nr:serine/threonine protein kinase, FIKK family [Plasmodium sp. DRC-Itaito]